MSVVKDAERLGDYGRNLHGIMEPLDKPVDKTAFAQYFDDLDKEILDFFGQTRDAFINADEEKARSA